MKKPDAKPENLQKLNAETIKKVGRRFAFIPLILGVLIAQWKGTKAFIPILIVGVLLIPVAILAKQALKKK
jgi:hypothetical protein